MAGPLGEMFDHGIGELEGLGGRGRSGRVFGDLGQGVSSFGRGRRGLPCALGH